MSEATNDLIVKVATPIATAVGGAIAAWLKTKSKATKEKTELKGKNQELADKLTSTEDKLNKEHREQAVLVARGLAVGYYANFVRAVSAMVENGDIQVRLDERDRLPGNSLESFGNRNTDLFCIIPEEFSSAREKDCFDRLQSHHKGAIVRGPNIRDFDINYALSTRDEKRVLQIYDVAKPLFALRSYLKEFRNFDENNPDWQSVTQPAVKEFRDTVVRMLKGQKIRFEFEPVR